MSFETNNITSKEIQTKMKTRKKERITKEKEQTHFSKKQNDEMLSTMNNTLITIVNHLNYHMMVKH